MDSINDNRKVFHMNEINKRKVVEHNDLITGVADMGKTPLKIFELAVSCIDTNNPPEDNTIYLSKKELYNFFDRKDEGRYSFFKRSMDDISSMFFKVIDREKKDNKHRNIQLFSEISWYDRDDTVKIQFNKKIIPYLIGLQTNFTQYAISDIMELDSIYALLLYRWFSMYYRQYTKGLENNKLGKSKRSKEQLDKYKNPIITIKELRRMTNTLKEYSRFDNFEKNVLTKPVKEINDKTHFYVTYEKIKNGVRIDEIQFFITEKKDKLINEQPEERGNKNEEENSKQTFNELFSKAMQSNFTPLLFQNEIIKTEDMQNKELLEKLIKELYPLYDEIENLKKGEVSKHIAYVAKNRSSDNKSELVYYLKKSANSYIDKIKKRNEEQKNKPKKQNYSRNKTIRKEPEPDWSKEGYQAPEDADKLDPKAEEVLKEYEERKKQKETAKNNKHKKDGEE